MSNLKDIFTKSDGYKEEYSCRIVRIGQLHPIPGADRIATVYVGSDPIVVRKSEVKEGDVMFLLPRECTMNQRFMVNNNLYNIFHFEWNSNRDEVGALLAEAETLQGKEKDAKLDEAKMLCGIFNRNRVRSTKIRGQISAGFLFGKDALIKFCPEIEKDLTDDAINKNAGLFFDTVNGELFCKAYIPKRGRRNRSDKPRRKSRTEIRVEKYLGWLPSNVKKSIIRKFGPKPKRKLSKKEKYTANLKWYVDGSIVRHYDTEQLGNHIQTFHPDKTEVYVSKKMHGTSIILSRGLREFPITDLPASVKNRNTLIKKLHLPKKFLKPETYRGYTYLYSSRNVVLNEDMNESRKVWQGKDVYTPYMEMFRDYNLLPKGVTVYGEIVGYSEDGGSIQGSGTTTYDYGCEPGTNKLLIYRITSDDENSKKREWDISEVIDFRNEIVKKHPELENKIMEFPLMYHGKIGDMFPELDKSNHWQENFIIALKNSKDKFFMEADDPECKNKVPFEGLVFRRVGDLRPTAYKIKSERFLNHESSQMDSGKITDPELLAEYGDDDLVDDDAFESPEE